MTTSHAPNVIRVTHLAFGIRLLVSQKELWTRAIRPGCLSSHSHLAPPSLGGTNGTEEGLGWAALPSTGGKYFNIVCSNNVQISSAISAAAIGAFISLSSKCRLHCPNAHNTACYRWVGSRLCSSTAPCRIYCDHLQGGTAVPKRVRSHGQASVCSQSRIGIGFSAGDMAQRACSPGCRWIVLVRRTSSTAPPRPVNRITQTVPRCCGHRLRCGL